MTDRVKLVLLPGLDGSGVMFRPLLPWLPESITPQVIVYPPDEPLGYDELLPRILDQLPHDEPFAVLGESFSGPLAIRVAATQPANLRGVILCASFVRSPSQFRAQWLACLIQPWMFTGFATLARVKTLLGGYSTKAQRDLLSEALSTVQPRVICHRLRAVLQVDTAAELAACRVPMLYLQGDFDGVVPAWNAAEIQAIYPLVRLAKLPAPHLVLQTQPEQSVREITAFLGLNQETPGAAKFA